jgi:hypothetical protein
MNDTFYPKNALSEEGFEPGTHAMRLGKAIRVFAEDICDGTGIGY